MSNVNGPRSASTLDEVLSKASHEEAFEKFKLYANEERGTPEALVLTTFSWKHPITKEPRYIQVALRGLTAKEHEQAISKMDSMGGNSSAAGAAALQRAFLACGVFGYRFSIQPHSEIIGGGSSGPCFDSTNGCWSPFTPSVLEREWSAGMADQVAGQVASMSHMDIDDEGAGALSVHSVDFV